MCSGGYCPLRRQVNGKLSHRKVLGTPVGGHVRALRKAQGLTLAELAQRSGVSVAMLSKIERDERNPTVAVTWGIADGLGVPLSRLLGLDEPREIIVIPRDRRKVFRESHGGFERYVLSPVFPSRGVELLLGVLPRGGRSGVIPAHQKSIDEYVVAARGTVEVRIGDERFVLRQGDAIYYDASREHEFVNLGRGRVELYMVINSSRLGYQ